MRTADVQALKDGHILAMQALHAFDVDGVGELCVALMDDLEARVFGSHVLVDKVYVYRSPVRQQDASASWLWHFDKLPLPVLKLLIYLTDVDEGTAPFEYLAEETTGNAVLGSRTPLSTPSRVSPETMATYLARGFRPRRVIGPRGTAVLLQPAVIHRETIATRSHRDVLVLQLRPVTGPKRPPVDARWTGSFEHLEFNPDPRDTTPKVRP